jgi:hypothetical protein
MNPFLSKKLFALLALVIAATGTGCLAEEGNPDAGEGDVPVLAAGELKTQGISFATGQGTPPDACPEGKEAFYNYCHGTHH